MPPVPYVMPLPTVNIIELDKSHAAEIVEAGMPLSTLRDHWLAIIDWDSSRRADLYMATFRYLDDAVTEIVSMVNNMMHLVEAIHGSMDGITDEVSISTLMLEAVVNGQIEVPDSLLPEKWQGKRPDR